MPDAKQISQLISKSLRREASQAEDEAIARHLEDDDQSRQFTELSRIIQSSVVQAADRVAEGTSTGEPSLSDDAKQRMKDSVRLATREKLSLSQAGLLRTEAGVGQSTQNERTIEETVDRKRQVSSEFRLIRRLGEGGLGNVWLARDQRLNRNVAIKELNLDSLQSPKAWERFHREAQITGQLEHPNIVPIYEFGDDRKSGEPFYTMRFVGKRTLSDAIEEHHDRISAGDICSLELHRLLTVFLDVCQAVAYAHSRGVIHRDLKPDNVALDNFGQVIVLDWGLAKLIDDCELAQQLAVPSTDGFELTKTMQGDVIGTPLYMAPEQAAGELDKIDQRTDVYGLGAILFAILTGNAPHERSSAALNSGELSSVLKQIVEGDTPKPRDSNHLVPSELEEVCVRAMAKKPHLRFESVTALAEAVESWMAGQSNKKSRYESLRMEGRELRADLQSTVSDLERNARFMSHLPPIQQLIRASTDQDIADWRERLATIYRGLLEANPDYDSVVYSRLDGDQFTELVRVERQSGDSGRIRVVPRSKLHSAAPNDFMGKVADNKPDDVVTSLVCDPLCDRNLDCVGLVAGVPVYDEQSEDLYGMVLIGCNIQKVLRRQLSKRLTAGEVIIACDYLHIMMHHREGQLEEQTIGSKVAEHADYFAPALETLKKKLEYIDVANAEVYGARIWLVPQQHGLVYLLRRKYS